MRDQHICRPCNVKYYKREFSFSIFPKVHPLSDGEKMTRFRQQVTVTDVNLGLYDSYYNEDNRVFNHCTSRDRTLKGFSCMLTHRRQLSSNI